MSNAKLRLDIITALDSAGIKATEQQIDGLQKQLEKINKNDAATKLENALGRMPGKLGGIGKALGGVAGKASLLIGAFTTGYEIGTMFFEKVQKGLLGWKDPLDQLIESNKKLKKWQDEEVKSWQKKANGMMSYYQTEQEMIDRSIAKINSQAQSYTRLAKAASEFANAGADNDIQQLERERFEDMLKLQANGEYEAAEQVDKVYSILKQELETKKKLAEYDAESNRQEKEYLANKEKATKLIEKADSLEKERVKLESWKEDLDAGLSNDEIDKNQAQINSRLRQIRKQMAELDKEANTLADNIDMYEVESTTREMNRATLVDTANLERDKLALSYDQSIADKGNLTGLEFTKEFVEQFNQSSIDSYNELKYIKENTEDLAEKLDELLSMK